MPIIPASTGVQQAAKLVQEMQKQAKPGGPGGPQAFAKTLQQNAQMHAPNQASPINKVELVKTQKVPTAIKSLFNSWNKDQNSMQKIMNVAMSGQQFSPSQLIMLQQATYKVTFELETMSKLVEQASSAVKTTMQTQV